MKLSLTLSITRPKRKALHIDLFPVICFAAVVWLWFSRPTTNKIVEQAVKEGTIYQGTFHLRSGTGVTVYSANRGKYSIFKQ